MSCHPKKFTIQPSVRASFLCPAEKRFSKSAFFTSRVFVAVVGTHLVRGCVPSFDDELLVAGHNLFLGRLNCLDARSPTTKKSTREEKGPCLSFC